MIIVTAKIEFSIGGSKYKPGDKLTVEKEKAQDLADKGFIKSLLKPIIDKMIREPKGRK